MQRMSVVAILLLSLFASTDYFGAGVFMAFAQTAVAEDQATTSTTTTATSSTTTTEVSSRASSTILSVLQPDRADFTRPEADTEREQIVALFEEQRLVDTLTIFNFLGYWVQQSVMIGVPANTIMLILLIPILATLVTFVRVVIGLPTLEMLVPIILAFAFVAVGIVMGLLILGSIIIASFVSRSLLREVKIMFFAKRSLSLLIVAFFVFAALVAGIGLDIERVAELSIFPVLILTLLGDSIVNVQLHQRLRDTIIITAATIALGLAGYFLATSLTVRDYLILYPELVLITIPCNLIIGRYFGLRVSEYFRFRTFQQYGVEE